MQRMIGNNDGGVTMLGRAAAGCTVTITDTSAGVTRSLGSATVGGDGSFSLTTHAKISVAATNTFTATASTAAGQSNDNLGLFQLSSAGNDTLSGTTVKSHPSIASEFTAWRMDMRFPSPPL
jgi:hypothetical protein